MLKISDFFQKFLKINKLNSELLETVSGVIMKNTGIELPVNQIEIKNDFIKLNCSPIFRNEIFMNKSKIEESLLSQKIFLKIR